MITSANSRNVLGENAQPVRSDRSGRPRRSAPRAARKAHVWPLCPATGKARFGERWDARQALERAGHLRALAQRDGLECSAHMRRAYRCPFCDGWHLTSQSLRAA